jgi:hypothetical protein
MHASHLLSIKFRCGISHGQATAVATTSGAGRRRGTRHPLASPSFEARPTQTQPRGEVARTHVGALNFRAMALVILHRKFHPRFSEWAIPESAICPSPSRVTSTCIIFVHEPVSSAVLVVSLEASWKPSLLRRRDEYGPRNNKQNQKIHIYKNVVSVRITCQNTSML